jgi:hypothetical protein
MSDPKDRWNTPVDQVDYKYKYPRDLDFRPGSELHNKRCARIMQRARAAHEPIVARYDTWKKIENKLKCFIEMSQAETLTKGKDPRKPVVVVVPTFHAIKEIWLTYLTQAFLADRPYFQFPGRGPEDTGSAQLLELLVDWQCQRTLVDMAIHTQCGDGITYGFGVLTAEWERQTGFRQQRPSAWIKPIMKMLGMSPGREPTVLYEGVRCRSIDPHLYLPDPNVPIHEPNRGEFVGWVSRDNIPTLLDREKSNPWMFNAKYLHHLRARQSQLFYDYEREGLPEYKDTEPVDVICMYEKLIPSAEGLGNSDEPENWVTMVGGDQLLLGCTPVDLNHNQFPVTVFAPDTDGRDQTPLSKLERVVGLQDGIDYYMKARWEYIRKCANPKTIIDPRYLYTDQVEDGDRDIWYVRDDSPWGEKPLSEMARQHMIQDITQGHMSDVANLIQIQREALGTVDMVQGIVSGGERRSAAEAMGARAGALSRLQHGAWMYSIQCMRPLGYLMASMTQQLMSDEVSLRVLGRNQEDLQRAYGPTVKVSPLDIVCEYDVDVRDGSIPNIDNLGTLKDLFAQISSNPELSARYDTDRLFQTILWTMGQRNARDFVRSGTPIQAKVMTPEEIDNGLETGNMIPVEKLQNA